MSSNSISDLPRPVNGDVRSFIIPPTFSIREVDGRRGGPGRGRGPPGRGPDFPDRGPGFPDRGPGFPDRGAPGPQIPIDPPKPIPEDSQPVEDTTLGPILGKFVGTFKGTGMNTIFRPNSNFGTNLSLDNLLEINLTSETLQFMSGNVLGDVPNRGFDNQPDVFLRGVPYTQIISDKLNQDTGKADLPDKGDGKPGPHAVDIHFEQGLFMRTPATNSPAVPGATISRMGSIPHGTTINAQAFEPTQVITGKPDIKDVKIIPFLIGAQASEVQFANMQVPGDITGQGLRKPSNLEPFIKQGTLSIETVNNPNKILRDINEKKNIVSHLTFTVTTRPTDALPGGGVANIGFLLSGPKSNPGGSVPGNANAVGVTCQYWVSTVLHDLVIKAGEYDKQPKDLDILPEETKQGISAPKFRVQLRKKVSKDTTIQVPSTQIQYSQNVTLDFGVLSWPHISVATLIPSQPLLVTADSPLLASLK